MGCTVILANVPAECALERWLGFTTNVESTICHQSLIRTLEVEDEPTFEKCLSLLGRINKSG
jgi:hypothetical protein